MMMMVVVRKNKSRWGEMRRGNEQRTKNKKEQKVPQKERKEKKSKKNRKKHGYCL